MRRGSITVFLALMLTSLMVLSLTLSEAVRYGGLRFMVRQAGDSAVDSLFAAYDRKLLEDYGLLFFDGGFGEGLIQQEKLEETFSDYFQTNASYAGLLLGGSFFRLRDTEAVVTDIVSATDYRGEIFIRSVLDYYKFEGTADVLSSVAGKAGITNRGENTKAENDRAADGNASALAGTSGNKAEGEEGSGFDEKKYEEELEESPVGAARKLRRKGWVNMVLPEGRTVSGYRIDTGDFPSLSAVDDRALDSGSLLGRASEKALFNEYLLAHFSCFTEESERANVQYELEYILYGEDNDQANFQKVLNRLLLIREGLNLQHIMSDSAKKETVSSAAAALVGWTGLAPVVALTEAALMGAWAFAESLIDLKDLLAGYSVPLIKSEEDWNLSLSGVANFLKGESVEGKKSDKGEDYRGYLRILLYLGSFQDSAYRTMDMIQARMREAEPAFLMSSQIYALQIRTDTAAEPLFTGLKLVRSEIFGSGLGSYSIRDYFSEVY